MPYYMALVRKDPDSDYGVEFPDFPGCVTAASDVDEAVALAEEALRFHVAGMLEDGEPIPRPSPPHRVMADPETHDAVAVLVELPEDANRTVPVTLPESALEEIDARAESEGLTRSEFLARAALEALRKSA